MYIVVHSFDSLYLQWQAFLPLPQQYGSHCSLVLVLSKVMEGAHMDCSCGLGSRVGSCTSGHVELLLYCECHV